MPNNTYSKDEKQRKEIESAREYNINWAKKRKALLKKNWEEMNSAYYPIFSMWTPPDVLEYRINDYINNRIKGTQNAIIYGYPEAYMKFNPDSIYTKNAINYQRKYGGDSDTAFNEANKLNGLAHKDILGRRALFLRQGRSGSAAHEFWHLGTNETGSKFYGSYGGLYKYNPQHFATVKYLKQDPYIQNLIRTNQLNWDEPVPFPFTVNNQNYIWTPDEVLARRASLMHYLNWDPTKKATLKDVREWRKKGLLGSRKPIKDNPIFYNTPNVNLDKLSDETILHLINDVALNDTVPSQDIQISDVYYARKGGLIKRRKK